MMKRLFDRPHRRWLTLALLMAAWCAWAVPGDRPASRRYGNAWTRQAERDAGQLVERGAVREATGVPGRQEVARRLWHPARQQSRLQTHAIVRDARRQERREQIRKRVLDTIERQERRISPRDTQPARPGDRKPDTQDESSHPTERRATLDPLSAATDRRITADDPVSATPSTAAGAAISTRTLSQDLGSTVQTPPAGGTDPAKNPGDTIRSITPSSPTTPTDDQPTTRPKPGASGTGTR
jgi:hypothetical protein